MRLQWSSEAAQEIMNRMRSAERGLEESLQRAQVAREALDAANADQEDRALKALALRLSISVSRLRQTTEALENLIDSVKRADSGFQNAETSISTMINRIGEARAAGRSEASAAAAGTVPAARAASGSGWTVPRPLITDALRIGENLFVDGWLNELTSDPDIFSKL